jgi:NAD(P)-dependent dehydrogenase (short-subunit alcohol dehydrogenase family)
MTEKTILVTGSTDGVGRFVASRLAAAGALVLIHGRDRQRGEGLVAEIAQKGGKARFYQADLASLVEVRQLAEEIAGDHRRLDVLVNNAGIGSAGRSGRRETSRDGHELRFAVNYLAGFLLTRLLLPLIKASAAARIVNVSSAGQEAIDFDDVMLTHGYSGTRAYCQSKLAQIMFTFDLAQELAGSRVTATCLHPATYMNTTMVRAAGHTPISTVGEGAEAILNLAASAATEGETGLYFNGLRQARVLAQAYDAKARARLRALSFELCGLPDDHS